MKHRFSRIAATGAGMFAILASFGAVAQNKTMLTVYTAIENEELAVYKRAFETANPDIEIRWVRDSSGVITARIIAEKDTPRADVFFSMSASSVLLYQKLGLVEPYAPKGAAALKPIFQDHGSPVSWAGTDAFLNIICFNTIEAAKGKIASPTTWRDLTKPEFKGKVVMPHPASSGTGYITITGWIQAMGEENAWKFMDALHENIAVYTHSGSAPCVQAAKGERVAGIAVDTRGATEKSRGAPIELIAPSEGIGWDLAVTGIMKGTKHLEAAKRLADWSASKQANELYSKFYGVVGHPEVKTMPPNYPVKAESLMVKNDLNWMAEERERILAEWSKRYDGKAAPK